MRPEYFEYQSNGGYESPSYSSSYQDLQTVEGEGQYFGLPYVSQVTPSPYQDLQTVEGEGQYFGLPYIDPRDSSYGISRVGPSASVMPRGPASLFGVFAGSLFSPRSSGRASYKGRVPYQRAFTVEMQDRLRRRRRGRR